MPGRDPSSPADRRKNPARKKSERRKSPPPKTSDSPQESKRDERDKPRR